MAIKTQKPRDAALTGEKAQRGQEWVLLSVRGHSLCHFARVTRSETCWKKMEVSALPPVRFFKAEGSAYCKIDTERIGAVPASQWSGQHSQQM